MRPATATDAQPGPLVGRRAELAQLKRHLEAGAGLISLVGPRGMGKTCLARSFCASVMGPRRTVRICDARPCRTAGDLWDAVRATLGLVRTTEPVQDTVLRALGARAPVLLLMDGLGGDADAATSFFALASTAAGTTFLATSPRPIGVAGEIVLPVLPLEPAAAEGLLRARSGLSPDVASELAERGVLRAVAERVGRIPLALEIVAKRAGEQGPLWLEQWHESSPPGSTEAAWLSPLRDAIEWSLELLTSADRRALAQLSMFTSTFDAEAGRAVVGETDTPGRATLDRLVGVGLVSWELHESGAPRYRLQTSVREVISASGAPDPPARRRFAEHYVSAAEAWAHELRLDGSEVAIARLQTERHNVLAAIRAAMTLDPALAARGALALERLYWHAGPLTTYASLLEEVQAASRESLPPLLEARLLRTRAEAMVGDAALEARKLAKLASKRARAEGCEQLAGDAELTIARSWLRAGEIEKARRAVARARATYVAAGCRGGLVDADVVLLTVANHARDEGGIELAHAALAGARALGRVDGIASLLAQAGSLHLEKGELPQAIAHLEEGLRAAKKTSDTTNVARCLAFLGTAQHELGRMAEARVSLYKALDLARGLGHLAAECSIRGSIGLLELEVGEPRVALKTLSEAEDLARSQGNRRMASSLSSFAAIAAARLDELVVAGARLERARALASSEAALIGQVAELAAIVVDRIEAARLGKRPQPTPPRGVVPPWSDLRILQRLLERVPAPTPRAGRGELRLPDLEIGPGATWFRVRGGERVRLGRRESARRILEALLRAHERADAAGLGLAELAEAGWPHAQLGANVARNRVHVVVRWLRSAGLGELLVTRGRRYVLDEGASISSARRRRSR